MSTRFCFFENKPPGMRIASKSVFRNKNGFMLLNGFKKLIQVEYSSGDKNFTFDFFSD